MISKGKVLQPVEYRFDTEPYYESVGEVKPVTACRSAIAQALTDDPDMLAAVNELGASLF